YILFYCSIDPDGVSEHFLLISRLSTQTNGPVSVKSHTSKMFESLLPSVECYSEQHGFRSERSTSTFNIIFWNYIYDYFLNRSRVDLVNIYEF
ncbi:Uncharacterized protein FWK35_00012035, partial [Aphis craccivora]